MVFKVIKGISFQEYIEKRANPMEHQYLTSQLAENTKKKEPGKREKDP